jgi:ATP-binding cassette subfamily B protein
MGGRFETEAPAGGHGMRYAIELPMQPLVATPPRLAAAAPLGGQGTEIADAVVRPVQPPAPPALEGLKVMCVDDDTDGLQTLALVLHAEGAAVLPFARGREALEWLEQHPCELWPQLLACDISLAGEEDGHAVMRRIRQLEAERGVPLDRRLPAIALTGLARPENRLMALMAGFQLHLAKPVDPAELIGALATLAGRGGGTPPGRPRLAA